MLAKGRLYLVFALACIGIAHLVDATTAEGKAFLKANKDAEGVISLPSGLQYKVLK